MVAYCLANELVDCISSSFHRTRLHASPRPMVCFRICDRFVESECILHVRHLDRLALRSGTGTSLEAHISHLIPCCLPSFLPSTSTSKCCQDAKDRKAFKKSSEASGDQRQHPHDCYPSHCHNLLTTYSIMGLEIDIENSGFNLVASALGGFLLLVRINESRFRCTPR